MLKYMYMKYLSPQLSHNDETDTRLTINRSKNYITPNGPEEVGLESVWRRVGGETGIKTRSRYYVEVMLYSSAIYLREQCGNMR